MDSKSTTMNIEDEINVSAAIDNVKAFYVQELHQVSLNSVDRYRQMLQLQQQDYVSYIVLPPYLSAIKRFDSRRLVSRFRCGCHGLHVDTGNFNLLDIKYLGNSVLVLFVALTQQILKMSITLFFTALHIPQSEIVFLPFSGDQPRLCLLSSDYMIPDSLPSFCMNLLHTGLGC